MHKKVQNNILLMSGTYNNIIYMYNYKWTSKCLTVVLKYSLYCVKCLILLLEHDFQTPIKHQFLHVLDMNNNE